jgi:hypothetical protein
MMRRISLLAGVCAALGMMVWSTSATADPTAGPPICKTAGAAVSGAHLGLRLTGDNYVPAGSSLNVTGNLVLAPGACLDAFTTATVNVFGDIHVLKGAVLALGCTPQSIGPVPPCGATTTSDLVTGDVIARQPLTMYLDGDTIHGNVVSRGGGPGATLSPYVNFPIKDNTITGDVTVTGWQGAWFGLLRNKIGGEVLIARTTGLARGDDGSLDSTEITDNTIGASLVCRNNNPPAQVGDSGGGPNSVFSFAKGECAGLL